MKPKAKDLIRLFDAKPMVHPHVKAACDAACEVLKQNSIPFALMGGMALNQLDVGRPTKDVNIVVAKKNWNKAIQVLQQAIATDSQGIRFGLKDEPGNGLAIIGPFGVPIEVWPAGITHNEIAFIRGQNRPHPAGGIALAVKQKPADLINAKLASYLSARDRLRDAADVQALIKRLDLPLEFALKLDPRVRPTFVKIWHGHM